MTAEGGENGLAKTAEAGTAFQKALHEWLAKAWADPVVRAHPFFMRWAEVLKLGPGFGWRDIARQCCGGLKPTYGLQRISKVVQELQWPAPRAMSRVHQGVVESVELMTLVLCERRVQEAALEAGRYERDGLPALPTSSQLAAALIAAAWLNRRVKLTLDAKGQPFALNVLSDLPPLEFGFRGPKEARAAELVAYLQHTSGGGPAGAYRQKRLQGLSDLESWGMPSDSDIDALLQVHREDGEPDPIFGLPCDTVLAVDGEACRWMKDRFGVETFTYLSAEPTDEDKAFRGLQGILLQQVDAILKRIHAGSLPARTPTAGEAAMTERQSIFISYSHEDKDEWLPRFQKKLAVLERHASIDVWDDTRIRTGDDWYAEIDRALQACRVALLLISDGFLSSSFIAEKEFPDLLARHREGGMRVYPILLKDCMWELDPELKRLQIKMADGTQPLEACKLDDAKLNAEMTRIAREVLAIIEGR